MTTPPITTLSDEMLTELEVAAKCARPECCGEVEPSGVSYGGQHEMICCGMHAEDHGDVEYFHDKATPDTILTLLAERAELKKMLAHAIAAARRAIGDHYAPGDCYATGPLTGDPFRDLVECPACAAIALFDRFAAMQEPKP